METLLKVPDLTEWFEGTSLPESGTIGFDDIAAFIDLTRKMSSNDLLYAIHEVACSIKNNHSKGLRFWVILFICMEKSIEVNIPNIMEAHVLMYYRAHIRSCDIAIRYTI